MNYIDRVEHWGDVHHPKYLDILRIVFGAFLIIKGIEFANSTTTVTNLVTGQIPFNSFMVLFLVQYIVFSHIMGGFLISIGMLTRAAALVQIPILLGAIIFVDWQIMLPFSQFLVALFTLILLIMFSVVGSGPWSVDHEIDVKHIR
jgi:uncharacterized membrane protein YphA (DoxX/SURF4 family)